MFDRGWVPQECTHRAEVSFMTEKVGFLLTLRPEADSVRESVHRLMMSSNETSAEIDVLHVINLGMQVRELAYVVADGVEEAPADILWSEAQCLVPAIDIRSRGLGSSCGRSSSLGEAVGSWMSRTVGQRVGQLDSTRSTRTASGISGPNIAAVSDSVLVGL